MDPLFVNFHTSDAGYTEEARGLVESLGAHGLDFDSVAVPPFESWVKTCSYKPAFVQAMRKKHAGRPLVWLDADARVLRYPDLLMTMPAETDFAAHWLRNYELLSGTLYLGATLTADRLIDSWAAACAASPDEWDQRVLQRVAQRTPGLKITRLPPIYAWIQGENFAVDADISGRFYGQKEPVIRHRQASRRLKFT